MLKIITKNNHFLQRKFIQAFGGSGGPVNVNLEKDAKWIKYKTSRELACVDGIEDIHVKHMQYYPGDPYEHLENQPYFSFNRLIYNDPLHHDPDHEQYADQIHGYILGDDPNDMRYDVFIPGAATLATLSVLVSFYFYSTFNTPNEAVYLHEATYMQKRIDDVLSVKAQRIAELQQQIAEIKEKRSQ